MTAKEYFKKYEKQVMNCTFPFITVLPQIYSDLDREAWDLIEARHIQTSDGRMRVIREVNKKMMVLRGLFIANCSINFIPKNGFIAYWNRNYAKKRGPSSADILGLN